MTTEAAANPSQDGSDSVQPSTSLDDPANLTFFEPNEANEEDETASESADETDEAPVDEGSQEAETPTDEQDEGETDETAEDADKSSDPDDQIITLHGGEQVTLKELKLGNMRDRDYRHKTTEIAKQRRGLEEMTTRVQRSVDAIADFLAKQIPPAPEPSLAMTNPTEYVRQKAMYDASMAQITTVIEAANDPKDVVKTLSE